MTFKSDGFTYKGKPAIHVTASISGPEVIGFASRELIKRAAAAGFPNHSKPEYTNQFFIDSFETKHRVDMIAWSSK